MILFPGQEPQTPKDYQQRHRNQAVSNLPLWFSIDEDQVEDLIDSWRQGYAEGRYDVDEVFYLIASTIESAARVIHLTALDEPPGILFPDPESDLEQSSRLDLFESVFAYFGEARIGWLYRHQPVAYQRRLQRGRHHWQARNA